VSATNSGLARNTAIMAVGTMLSRVTGFGRTVVMVAVLGVGLNNGLPDAYNVANNVPNAVYELILGGILTGTLVPVFVRHFAGDEEDGWRAVSAILTATAVVLVLLTVVVVITAPWIIDLYTKRSDSASSDEMRSVATFLLRLFAPQVAFYGFISIATAVLQARRRFAVPMFAPILNNLVVIAMLLAFPMLAGETTLAGVANDNTALLFLGLGTTAGVASMAFCLLPPLLKASKGHVRWLWAPRHEAIRTVVGLSGWTVGFVIANQIALFVTLFLALGNGGESTIFLQAYTFFILPHGIFTVSVISAMQPDLAERWTRHDLDGFRTQTERGFRIIAAVIIPAAVGYALLAHPIVNLIPQGGEFDPVSADRLADAVFWMIVGLPGFSFFITITRAFQAMPDARTVFWLYVLQNGINIATAFPFHASMGVNGLALSHSVSYTAAAIAGAFLLARRTNGLNGKSVSFSIVRTALAAAVMGLVMYGVINVVPGDAITDVVAGILAGTVTYLVACRIVGAREIEQFLRSRLPGPKR
jgi:putative peptidoglycan lipid II flippase